MRRFLSLRVIAPAAAVLLLAAGLRALPFDHVQHASLFVRCQTCHAGAAETGRPLWPAEADCAQCHNGKVKPAVAWSPPTAPVPNNLRFAHDAHRRALAARQPHDSSTTCATCHSEAGAGWMHVQRDVVGNCINCHQPGASHFEASPAQCATCHVRFWEMPPGITDSTVARWKAPPSHAAPDFQATHGKLAAPVTVGSVSYAVSPSCSTCHAQEYCIACHVNAPEVPVIQAMKPDARSLAMKVPSIEAPASHANQAFLTTHGRKLTKQQVAQQCSTCHTATSCEACHLVPPQPVRTLAVA